MYLLENGQKPKKQPKTPETKLIFPYFDIFEKKKIFQIFFQKFFPNFFQNLGPPRVYLMILGYI